MTSDRTLASSHVEERFREMFARYHPAIYGYAARRVGRLDANDVAAETFTVAWRRVKKVPTEPATLPWLYGVARKVIANLERTRRRTGRLVAKEAAHQTEVPVEAIPDVMVTIARLGDDDREILLLAAWEGLTPSQIGEVIGCSPNTAAVRLHRARGRLEAAMEGDI